MSNRKLIYVSLVALMISGYKSLNAQSVQITGTVLGTELNGKKYSLPFANVFWEETLSGTSTDEKGFFKLAVIDTLPHNLIISYVGYYSDTIQVNDYRKKIEVQLKSQELKTVQIISKRQTTEISTLKPINSELITEGELLKAACCNLSESFETNPSVDVNYNDAVTGSKEIQLLGLSGIYTQTLAENIPTLKGLAVPYGLNYVPGPWMSSIQISKGAGSVANGYEAITGQINVEFKKPEKTDHFFINLFQDDQGRSEFNSINNIFISKRWKYMLMTHADYIGKKSDHNNDGFLDQPLTKQINVYNRLFYNDGKKLEGQIGLKTLYEDRVGGQVNFNKSNDKGTTNSYGFGVVTKRAELYTKTGLIYPKTPYKSMGLQTSFTYHEQDAFFGLKKYSGNQKSAYFNFSHINIISTTDHHIKAGADYKYDDYNESYNDSAFFRIESVPGIFGEYTYGGESKKFGAILGARVDYHNLFGWLFTPRLHLKYNLSPEFIIRLSGGRGFRTPNPFADNIGVMVSSKKLLVLEKPNLEDAWNGGLNITTRFKFLNHEGSLALDYYRTEFKHQLIIDQYSRPDAVLYYNLIGKSYANSFQTTLTYELIDRLNIKLAYKLDDVHTDFLTQTNKLKPLVSRDKALVNFSFKTRKEFWIFDATLQWEGVKPLPATNSDAHHMLETNYSPDFYMMQAQVTRVFKTWDIYFGGENLLDFTQHNPIIASNSPFSSNFDASNVWGPIMGRKFYIGIRLSIK